MATYKEIHGTVIETVTSDPDNPVNGQVWYNSTDQALKGNAQTTAGSWSSAPSLNTARYGAGSAAADNTAAIVFGGFPPVKDETELWNGSSWTEVADMNQANSFVVGTGTYTAALAFGGGPGDSPGLQDRTESWNGSSWTEVGDLNTARQRMGSAGLQTSAVAFGGDTDPGPSSALSETWNGSSWTETNNLNTARRGLHGSGVAYTAALGFGGISSPPSNSVAITESWDGTNWTEVGDLNTDRAFGGGGGTTTAALMFGGTQDPPRLANTEQWNGTSWTEVNDLNTAIYFTTGDGTVTSAILGSGFTTTTVGTAETWTGAGANSTVTFTVS